MTTLQQSLAQMTITRRRQVRKLVVIRTLWLALVAGLLLVAADVFLHFGDAQRLLLDLAGVVGLVVAVVLSRRWLMRSAAPARMLARMVEERNPELQNDLVSAVEFDEALATGTDPRTSRELMQHHIHVASAEAAQINSAEALKPPSLKQEALVLIGAVAVIVAMVVMFTDVFREVLPRFFDPFGDHPPYSLTRFKIDPTGGTVHYGESLRVAATTTGRKPKMVTLVLQNRSGQELAALPMFDAGQGEFFQTIENLREDLVYFARTADARSRRYAVSIIRWPRIDTVTVAYEYPAYTHLRSERRLLHEKVLKGYRQTRATISITSNKPLRGGRLVACGKEYALTPGDTTTVSATFPITENGTFEATITDRDGNLSRDKLSGKVEVIPDLKPAITVVHPGHDSFAIPTAKVPINIEATDDLGVSKVEIFRNHNGSEDARKTIYADAAQEKLVNVIETLDLADLGVKPGDTIEYYVSTTDSAPDAPQSAATTAYRLAIISAEEYRAYLQAQSRAEQLTQKYSQYMEKLEALADEQERLTKQINELLKKAQTQGALSPEEKAELQQALARQQELAHQTEELAKELTAAARTPPIYDVEVDYKRAQMRMAEALRAARESMNKSADSLSQAHAAEKAGRQADGLLDAYANQQVALDKLGRNVGDYQRGIQSANRDIEKMARLQEDVESFKHLLGLQKDLERQTRSFKEQKELSFDDKVRLKELAEQQDAVRQGLGDLKKDLREHSQAVEKDYPKVAQDARDIAQEIEKRDIEKLMQAATRELARPDQQSGHAQAQAAYEQMEAMVQRCQNASGQAEQECEERLRIQMNTALGNTLRQLAKRFGYGMGVGPGRMGAGADGVAGTAAPFDLFGTEQPGSQPRESSRLGRRGQDARIAPGEPAPLAASIEELGAAKNTELDLHGAGGERFMEEYRRLIEEYFKRLAEE